MKGVDDHCGYRLPWDPLQWGNDQNTEFHDVHHQSWGIKVCVVFFGLLLLFMDIGFVLLPGFFFDSLAILMKMKRGAERRWWTEVKFSLTPFIVLIPTSHSFTKNKRLTASLPPSVS